MRDKKVHDKHRDNQEHKSKKYLEYLGKSDLLKDYVKDAKSDADATSKSLGPDMSLYGGRAKEL